MNQIFKQLFSKPTRPAGKVSQQDIISSLKRLIGALIIAIGFWLSTDLAQVLNDGTREMGCYVALVYSVADLIQVIARQSQEQDDSK